MNLTWKVRTDTFMNLKIKQIFTVLVWVAVVATFFVVFYHNRKPEQQIPNKNEQYSLKNHMGNNYTNHYTIYIDHNGMKERAEATVSNSMVYYYSENNSLKWSFDGEAFFRNFNYLPFRGIRSFFYTTNDSVVGYAVTNGIVVVYGKFYLVFDPETGRKIVVGSD